MLNIKKIALILLAAVSIGTFLSIVHAEDIDTVMRDFRAAQTKLRQLRQAGAPSADIAAQEEKVRVLRDKASELQSEIGQ